MSLLYFITLARSKQYNAQAHHKQACVRAMHKSIMGTFSQEGPFRREAAFMYDPRDLLQATHDVK
jgi:hypothetical protein